MLFEEVLANYKSSLLDSASVFKDDQLTRHLKTALLEYSKYKPLIKDGSFNLIANIKVYPAPVDLFEVIETFWAREQRKTMPVWSPIYPENLPRLNLYQREQGYELVLSRAVTESEISLYGQAYEFTYKASQILGDDLTKNTLLESAIPIVLIRAQAEAAREMALRNIHKPVSLNTPVGGVPSNGTPMGIYQALMIEFEKQVKC
jgi:hypothetical protein